MFDPKEIDPLIRYMLRNVSPHIREDCYQAAMLGVIHALKKYDPEKSKLKTYLNTHKGYIQDEILKEVAKLSFPFTISKTTLINLIKYNRGSLSGATKGKLEALNKLSQIRQYSYEEQSE